VFDEALRNVAREGDAPWKFRPLDNGVWWMSVALNKSCSHWTKIAKMRHFSFSFDIPALSMY
jgi:hypothetical protein